MMMESGSSGQLTRASRNDTAAPMKDMIAKPPEFPIIGASYLLRGLQVLPLHQLPSKRPLFEFLRRVYPYHLMSGKSGTEKRQHMRSVVESSLVKFGLLDKNHEQLYHDASTQQPSIHIKHIDAQPNAATVQVAFSSNEPSSTFSFTTPVGDDLQHAASSTAHGQRAIESRRLFVGGSYEKTLANLLHDHAIGKDMCIVGERGSGKSVLVRLFADALGYDIQQMMLYRDMCSRDLTLHRTTTDTRSAASSSTTLIHDTQWQHSPLIHAAIHGKLAVLDNIDRLPPTLLSSLASLIQSREVHDSLSSSPSLSFSL